MYTLDTFYRSDEWRRFRDIVIAERLTPDGLTVCECCGRPIVRAYDIILHHCNTFLTEENVNDVQISLNPENIQIVDHSCHNKIHGNYGHKRREVFLVYGSPLSGKTSYVESVRERGDLVIDIDSIWQCVSACDRYVKPQRLTSVVFAVRDTMLDAVKHRLGKWNNAYIIGGYPYLSERERIMRAYGAREVFVDTPKDECISRLKACADRDYDEWIRYIDDWWEKFVPTSPPCC